MPESYEGKVRAPEFPSGLDWMNSDRPVALSEFRGKIVILDFWTFCCINCMHILPQLAKLEQKYPDELAVIGVHSAKFMAEKSSEAIRQAILRYHIEHPVVNDKDFTIWRSYGVRAWPTLMFIDPEGKVIGRHQGEISFDSLDRVVADMVRQFDSRGILDRHRIKLTLEKDKERDRPLSCPGKVLADAASGRLFIADSNHNRVVVATLDGVVTDVVGSGHAGLADGDFASAAFNNPQGMAIDGDALYVADARSHVRRIDLAAKSVTTIAGAGGQAMRLHRGGHGPDVQLNSPYDLALHNGALFIAMAGFHQIWKMDLASGLIGPHAGSGTEGIADGPAAEAMLAQPYGIATDGDALYFADSETSAVRRADIHDGGAVTTIVGTDLFQFGDADGVGEDARLQHVQGLALHNGLLYITDTYNNKIKTVDPATREAVTFAGDRDPGMSDGAFHEARFYEPAGVSPAHGKLYVADPNNHAIRVIDIPTRWTRTLTLDWSRLPEAARTGATGGR